mgnify:CR=1 FL=1
MAEGKKGESLNSFFDSMTDEQKSKIEAVGIDRGGAYKKAVNEKIPNAAIVYDKFHLILNLNEAINEVRREAWRKASKQDRKVLKGQRFNLLRSWHNSTPDQQRSLKALLNINEDLNICYILKEAIGHIWQYKYQKSAENCLRQWIAWAEESCLPALQRFARGLWKAKDGILSFCKHPITNGMIEAFNNQIARLLHRSCGIKDLRYLFLQLRQQYLSADLQ